MADSPLIRKLPTDNATECCNACHAEPTCVAWNTNSQQHNCCLRSFSLPGKTGPCTSGLIRPNPPGPPPHPSPAPSPPPRRQALTHRVPDQQALRTP
eukprot:gene7223-6817_t